MSEAGNDCTVVLHVGMHKTGTTSIQRSLQHLDRQRARYMQLGGSNHTVPIVTAFSPDPARMEMHRRAGRGADELAAMKRNALQRLDSELALAGKYDKMVISGEGIVTLPPPALRELRAVLLRGVPRVQVFAYLREPVGYSVSAFQQRVKDGGGLLRLVRPEYRKRFERFVKVFGRDHFSPRVFARDKLKGGSAVADFCDVWSLPFDPKEEVRSNESISEPVVKLLHLFNRQGPEPQTQARWRNARTELATSLAAHFPGRFELPPEFHAYAVDPEDLEWLEQELGIAFPGETATPAPEREFQDYLEAIDAGVVSSYRELLGKLGIRSTPSDTALALLERHFERCLVQASDGRRPR
jgi:hypothetical protein